MRFLVAKFVLPMMALLMLALPVSALGWCKSDPIVQLGDDRYQVLVGVPEENVKQVNGPLEFVISSPRGTVQKVLFLDSGFNGHGERVRFNYHVSSLKHIFYLKVPHSGGDGDLISGVTQTLTRSYDFPVQMEIFKNGTLIKTAVGDPNGMVVSVPVN